MEDVPPTAVGNRNFGKSERACRGGVRPAPAARAGVHLPLLVLGLAAFASERGCSRASAFSSSAPAGVDVAWVVLVRGHVVVGVHRMVAQAVGVAVSLAQLA